MKKKKKKKIKNMGGNIPGGNFPERSLMGGNFPDGNFPGGSFPDTSLLVQLFHCKMKKANVE